MDFIDSSESSTELSLMPLTRHQPLFATFPDGFPHASWPDEDDPRWLVGVFLTSEVGVSEAFADRVVEGLANSHGEGGWSWGGNSCRLSAVRGECSLTADDGDVRPVALSCAELERIVRLWRDYFNQSPRKR